MRLQQLHNNIIKYPTRVSNLIVLVLLQLQYRKFIRLLMCCFNNIQQLIKSVLKLYMIYDRNIL